MSWTPKLISHLNLKSSEKLITVKEIIEFIELRSIALEHFMSDAPIPRNTPA